MLREQVITPRAGRSGGNAGKGRAATGGGLVQRPARRSGGRGGAVGAATRGKALAWLPLALKLLLACGVGLALFAGYRAAASASFFAVRAIEVDGARRASADEMKTIVRRATATTGVWRADIAAISEQLGRQPWVRAAVVSRVLPSGLRVRVQEREPVMIARASNGRLVWVDEEGVMLGTAATTDPVNSFFVRGLEETTGDTPRPENRERMKRVLEMRREWESAGLAARVSEVNLDDLRDVRAQLTGDKDSQIEIRLGGKDFGARLDEALKTLDKVRQKRPDLTVTRLDATQVTFDAARGGRGGRVIVGHKSGGAAHTAAESNDALTDGAAGNDSAATVVAPDADVSRTREKKPVETRRSEQREDKKPRRVGDEAARKPDAVRERQVTERTPTNAVGQRPRRVG